MRIDRLLQDPVRAARLKLLLAALVLGGLLRLVALGGPSLTVDEGVVTYLAFPPTGNLVQRIHDAHEVHPPGYFWLVHLWSRFGRSEGWLRLSSAVAGLAAIPLLWWMAPDRPAAALLLAGLTYQVQYSRELRMYPLLGLLAMVAFCCILRWRENGRFAWLAGYAITCAVAFWIHYFAFFIPLVAVVAAGRERLAGWFGASAVAGLAFLPWLPDLLQQIHSQNLALRHHPGWYSLPELLGRMALGDVGPDQFPWWLGYGLAGVLLAVVVIRSPKDPLRPFLLTWLLLPPLVAYLVSAVTPLRVFEFKYFFFCAPALCYLLGKSRLVPALLVLNLASWGLLYLYPYGGNQDWRRVAQLLEQSPSRNRLVLVQPSMMAAPLLYYGVPPQAMRPVDTRLPPDLDDYTQVWLVTTPYHPLVERVGLEGWLDHHLHRVSSQQIDRLLPSAVIRVVRYVPRTAAGRAPFLPRSAAGRAPSKETGEPSPKEKHPRQR